MALGHVWMSRVDLAARLCTALSLSGSPLPTANHDQEVLDWGRQRIICRCQPYPDARTALALA
jgi:hypothetical protein